MASQQHFKINPNAYFYLNLAPSNNLVNVPEMLSSCLRKSFNEFCVLKQQKSVQRGCSSSANSPKPSNTINLIEISSESEEREENLKSFSCQQSPAKNQLGEKHNSINQKQIMSDQKEQNKEALIFSPISSESRKKSQNLTSNFPQQDRGPLVCEIEELQLDHISPKSTGILTHHHIDLKKARLLERKVQNWDFVNKKYQTKKRELRTLQG